MKITNRHELPESYWRANAEQRPFTPGRISVTELLTPPQMRSLRIQFDHEMEEDCADRIDAFFGTAVHAYLERYADSRSEAEKTIEWTEPESGWTVHGTPDLHGDGTLIDWKTTRVRALQYDRQEWQDQVNLYAHLLRLNGKRVSEIVVWAFCKDYDPQKRWEDGYPTSAVVKIPMPLWDADRAHEFLLRRLRLHQAAERGIYGPCTPEERWQRDTWAVYPLGKIAARAKAVFAEEVQALDYAVVAAPKPRDWQNWFEIVKREGEPVRCMNWCVVREKCQQWQAERPDTLTEELEASVIRLEARA